MIFSSLNLPSIQPKTNPAKFTVYSGLASRERERVPYWNDLEKVDEVERILCQNRERIIALLTTGLAHEEDEVFEADMNAVHTT